ncbi:hypothetical protein [Pseudomonas huaxiensis]|uniref:hypothetical protein n=1 Tax=Pseudomonas huaxiensis TaxID=2213017 RepID=UPI000DA65B7E|nr:hypothetical protein [Pseudomonas huaxiensis]
MKPAPHLDPWPLRPAPRYMRWMVSGLLVLALVGCAGVLLRPLIERWLPLIGALVLALWLLALLLRTLFYRFNRHNAECYSVAAQQVEQRWWTRYRQQAALVEMVLIGPACSAPEHREALFMVERKPPIAKDGALRVSQVFARERSERECTLAKRLVLQLHAQHPEPFSGPVLYCYWQGSPAAWNSFASEMSRRFTLVLPEQPEPWLGLHSLDSIIDRLQDAPEDALVLCAGCESVAPHKDKPLPAGEAAVLWLLGQSGGVRIARGDGFVKDTDDLADVAGRVLQQSGLEHPASACASFARTEGPELSDLEWNPIKPAPEVNFGELEQLSAMVALSLAAAHTALKNTPSTWLADDPSCTLGLGVVVPDDSTH